MDNGFKDRVDKVFGSITSSSSSSWSVTDAKVERREWKRSSSTRNDDEIPVSFCLNQEDDDFDIRSSIGLDSTLDHEEEEDAYDKMAQGKENNDDCLLFMKDVTRHGPYLNSHNLRPFSTHNNASLIITSSLKQDEEDDDEPILPPNDGICRTKSILKKRKNEEVMSKPAKRVRFDPTCKNHQDDDNELTNVVQLPRISNNGSSVPDYILNPSKYTRYNLDDISHHSNEGSNTLDPESFGGELPRSLVFIPRKKKADKSEGRQSFTQAAASSSIAVAAQHGETSEILQGDDVCTKASKFQKPGRRYRSKMEEDDN